MSDRLTIAQMDAYERLILATPERGQEYALELLTYLRAATAAKRKERRQHEDRD
jgi:hypothetical protein